MYIHKSWVIGIALSLMMLGTELIFAAATIGGRISGLCSIIIGIWLLAVLAFRKNQYD